MKKALVFLFILSVFNGFSQDTITTYFSESWKPTIERNAKYYRKSYKKAKRQYVVKDYYMDGTIQMEGVYKDRKLKKRNGFFTYYHENGKKHMEGNFVKNKRVGEWSWWYEGGNLEEKGKFDTKGLATGYWKNYHEESGNMDSEGSYVKGKKDGTWKYYFENKQISSKEKFSNGVLLDFDFWNDNGKKIKTGNSTLVMPKYSEDEDFYEDFMDKNVKYPRTEKSKKHEGIVFIKVKVDKEGKVTDHEIFKSSGYGKLDDEALRVSKLITKMIPGKYHNRPEEFTYIIPVVFEL